MTKFLDSPESVSDGAGEALIGREDPRLFAGGGTEIFTGSTSAIENQLDRDLGLGWTLQLEDISITGVSLFGHQGLGQASERVSSDHVIGSCDKCV